MQVLLPAPFPQGAQELLEGKVFPHQGLFPHPTPMQGPAHSWVHVAGWFSADESPWQQDTLTSELGGGQSSLGTQACEPFTFSGAVDSYGLW